jgi:formylglycine-generating enzyme required for sulfatase activity
LDESRQLRRRTGDPTIVYIPSDRALSPQVEASPDQFAVLRLFDGERSLDQVVIHSHLPDLETLTHIVALGEKGLLEPSQAPRSSQLTLPVAPESETPELSFLPFAASLGVPPAQRLAPRRWLWMGVAAGAASLGSVFALRMSAALDAAQALAGGAPIPLLAAPAAAPAPAPVPVARVATCPTDMVLLGGPHPFCLGKHEVSAGDYEACRITGRCDAGLHETELPEVELSSEARRRVQALLSAQCNAGQPGRERHPMNCVTEKQAEHYCGAYAGRLPTEAEWEFAVGGKDEHEYPWGAARPSALQANACGSECKAWYASTGLAPAFGGVMFDADDGYVGTAPVGSFPAGASPEGVLDLIGNVAEWTASQVEFDDAEGADNRSGPYVVRGGDFSSGMDGLSAPALRAYLSDDTRSRTVGFRCAADPSQQERGATPSD